MELSRIPLIFTAGDSLAWRVSLSDYPPPDWTLSYRLINAVGKIDLVASQDGEDHLISIAAATSAAWATGVYNWVSHVTDGTDRYTIERGTLQILADLAAQAGGYESRSTARKALDDLRAALAVWIASDGQVAEAEFEGRRVRFASKADLLSRIALLEREVAREEQAERLAAGLDAGRRILVRFSP